MNGAALAGLCRAAKSIDKLTTASGLPPFALTDRPAASALRGVDTSLRTPAPFATSLHNIIGFHRLGLPYTIKPINIGRGDQLAPYFLKISPNGRMPAIADDEPMGGGALMSIFESGPIMLYLAEKTGRKVLSAGPARQIRSRSVGRLANGQSGPKLGEQGHFRRAAESGNNGDLSYALHRFDNEAHRIFGMMNLGLFSKRYFAAGQYTIADMICYPWASSWATRKIDIDEFPNVKRWLEKKSASGQPSRKPWRWGRSFGRIRLRSAPRSRPVAENSWQTSERSQFPRSGFELRRVLIGSGATIRVGYCEDVDHPPEGATGGIGRAPAAPRWPPRASAARGYVHQDEPSR